MYYLEFAKISHSEFLAFTQSYDILGRPVPECFVKNISKISKHQWLPRMLFVLLVIALVTAFKGWLYEYFIPGWNNY